MDSAEMKELASLVRNVPAFIDITIDDVRKIVRKEKQHLASAFECSSINWLLSFILASY